MLIEVTAEDIKKGEQGNCWRCPIALALIRAFRTDDVAAPGPYARINHERLDLPNEVRRFIDDFDNGDEVSPFTFELPIKEAA